MEKLLNQYLQKQISYGIIKEEDNAIYLYGLKQSVLLFLNVITMIIIGVVMNSLLESMVIMITLIPLRTFAGGYHASNQINCYILSVLFTIGMLWGVKVSVWSELSMLLIGVVCGGVIWKLSPVEDANKPLCELEKLIFRKRARIVLVGELFVMLVLSQVMENKSLVLCIEGVLLSEMVFLILGKWKLEASNK